MAKCCPVPIKLPLLNHPCSMLQACTHILCSSHLPSVRWFGQSYSEWLRSAWFLGLKSQQSRCLSRLLQNHKIEMSHIQLAECLFSRIHVRFILKIHSKTLIVILLAKSADHTSRLTWVVICHQCLVLCVSLCGGFLCRPHRFTWTRIIEIKEWKFIMYSCQQEDYRTSTEKFNSTRKGWFVPIPVCHTSWWHVPTFTADSRFSASGKH